MPTSFFQHPILYNQDEELCYLNKLTCNLEKIVFLTHTVSTVHFATFKSSLRDPPYEHGAWLIATIGKEIELEIHTLTHLRLSSAHSPQVRAGFMACGSL